MTNFNYLLIIPDLFASILVVINGKALISYLLYIIKVEYSFHIFLRILATLPALFAGLYILRTKWSLSTFILTVFLLSLWLIINIINNKIMMKKYNEENKNATIKKIKLS